MTGRDHRIAFGGGKSIMIDTPRISDRAEALRAFGRVVARHGGASIPAADMGTGVGDLPIVRETAGAGQRRCRERRDGRTPLEVALDAAHAAPGRRRDAMTID